MRQANAVVVGGPIAVGKSTLVTAMSFNSVPELDPNDELQITLLEQMYAGDAIAKHIFQLDILLTRFDKYKKYANGPKITLFDRSIFEDWIFAQALFGDNQEIWTFYLAIWQDKVNEIISEIGLPKLYILLECSWETFKSRLMSRNRTVEVNNFLKNEQYFRSLLETYSPKMTKLFKEYQMEYEIIKTDDLTSEEVLTRAKQLCIKKGIAV